MTAPLFVTNDDASDPERFWRYGNGLSWHMLTDKGLQFNQKRGGTNGFSTVMVFNSRHKLGAAVFTNIECNPLDIAITPLVELAPVFKRLEEESKKSPEQRRPPEFGSDKDFQLTQALNQLKGRPVLVSKTIVERKEEKKEN